jgi:hypothetical protein
LLPGITVIDPEDPIGNWSSQPERSKLPPGATFGLRVVDTVIEIHPFRFIWSLAGKTDKTHVNI